MLAIHWGWDSEQHYHGRLTGVPFSHVVRSFPLVASIADCPNPVESLSVRTQVLQAGEDFDRVRLYLSDQGHCLDQVDSVTWHLHPTFDDPDAPGWSGAAGFPITLVAWGMFDLTATVRMGGRKVEIPGQAVW